MHCFTIISLAKLARVCEREIWFLETFPYDVPSAQILLLPSSSTILSHPYPQIAARQSFFSSPTLSVTFVMIYARKSSEDGVTEVAQTVRMVCHWDTSFNFSRGHRSLPRVWSNLSCIPWLSVKFGRSVSPRVGFPLIWKTLFFTTSALYLFLLIVYIFLLHDLHRGVS
jgi:hypothetical protein